MSRPSRISAEISAAGRSFLRRRTAVFFTFVFPLLIVLIFGVIVQTEPTGSGVFAESPGWYIPGYLSVVVLFTPLSRVGSEVARHRSGNRFEKLATTPLRRWEWLFGQSAVNVGVIGLATMGLLVLIIGATGATVRLGIHSVLLVPFVVLAVGLFCGLGAILGSFAQSQDGVIAASNALALPLLFLSETFVPRTMLPWWLPTELSPLTYFARGVRELTSVGEMGATIGLGISASAIVYLGVLSVAAALLFVGGAAALPRTD